MESDKKQEEDIYIEVIYKPNIEDKKIRILGKKFVENINNNKNYGNKCKIIYKNKISEIREFFALTNIKEEIIIIKLKINKYINDFSYMFCGL